MSFYTDEQLSIILSSVCGIDYWISQSYEWDDDAAYERGAIIEWLENVGLWAFDQPEQILKQLEKFGLA